MKNTVIDGENAPWPKDYTGMEIKPGTAVAYNSGDGIRIGDVERVELRASYKEKNDWNNSQCGKYFIYIRKKEDKFIVSNNMAKVTNPNNLVVIYP